MDFHFNRKVSRRDQDFSFTFFYPFQGQWPDQWADIDELRDHNDERRTFDEAMWQEMEVKVSNFIRTTLKQSHFTDENVWRAIGILSTNNANFSMGEEFGKGAGLYITYSRVNHACNCNTKTLKYKDNR